MKIKDGLALVFLCRTKSLFHTNHREYTSLLKCAPYILGTTIRGALLRHMIQQQDCPHFDELQKKQPKASHASIHQNCELDCPVKPFFQEPTKVWFTFGTFKEPVEFLYKSITRISLDRNSRSVAEGGIVNIEAINSGTDFSFAIILFDECKKYLDLVQDCVNNFVAAEGLGRGRSYGMGKFKVTRILKPQSLEQFLARSHSPEPPKIRDHSLELEAVTPLVVGDGKILHVSVDRQQVGQWFSEEVNQALARVLDDQTPPWRCEAIDLQVNPDFISRFSHEMGLRENRYVFMEGSRLKLNGIPADSDSLSLLELALNVGIGEWATLGFGRLKWLAEKSDPGITGAV